MFNFPKEKNTNFYFSKMGGVIDGDTVDLIVQLGFGISTNARIRLFNIDAHEIRKVKKESEEFRKGKIDKLRVLEWFYNYDDWLILKTGHKDLYGRWIGEIFKKNIDESLNQYLLQFSLKTRFKPWHHQEPLLQEY